MAEVQIPVGYVQLIWSLVHTGIQHTALVTIGGKVESPPFTLANTTSCRSEFNTAYAPVHDNEVVYARCVALVGNDGPLLRYESNGTGAGTRAAQVVIPPNVSYLVKKTTAFSGRQYRGRMYLPYVSTNDVDQTGKLTTAATTLLNTANTNLLTNLVTVAGCNLSEVSLLHADRLDANGDPIPGSAPLPTPISSLAVGTFVATQRRRLKRV